MTSETEAAAKKHYDEILKRSSPEVRELEALHKNYESQFGHPIPVSSSANPDPYYAQARKALESGKPVQEWADWAKQEQEQPSPPGVIITD